MRYIGSSGKSKPEISVQSCWEKMSLGTKEETAAVVLFFPAGSTHSLSTTIVLPDAHVCVLEEMKKDLN